MEYSELKERKENIPIEFGYFKGTDYILLKETKKKPTEQEKTLFNEVCAVIRKYKNNILAVNRSGYVYPINLNEWEAYRVGK